ncbi:MAG: isopentenyl phosphate kinase [Candidatus Bathyarchaeia archaeon]
MEDLILLKLGGSLITDKTKPFTARLDVMKRLAEEIHYARGNSSIKLIVSHGGGSFPHTPAREYQLHKGVIGSRSYRGVAEVQDAAARLNRMVVRALIDAGENALSINPSNCCVAESGLIQYMYLEPIRRSLHYNMIPVPYGDIGFDSARNFSIISTEEILSYITRKFSDEGEFKPKKIIMCGVVDGVYAGDPSSASAKIIPEITPRNIDEIEKYLAGSSGIDVTGGMALKVKKLLQIAKIGVTSEIINAANPGMLKRALLGEEGLGTVIRC